MSTTPAGRSPSTAWKFSLLACLYFSQGLPYGFFTQTLPAWMRQEGFALPLIGLTSLLSLPWALKFFWAPLVDAFGSARLGRRRSWILPLQGLSVTLLAAMAVALAAAPEPATIFRVLLWGTLLTNLIAATQDIATDGLAVETLDHRERGMGNGIQVAGYRVGMVVGGGALLVVLDTLGWSLALAALALLLALASLPVLRHREVGAVSEAERPRLDLAMFLAFFRRPGLLWWLLLLLLYKGGDAIASGMLRPFLVDLDLDLADIGTMVGIAGFVAGLAGALAGGWGVVRFGRRRALVSFGVLQALAVAAYLIPALGLGRSAPLLYAVTSLDHFAGGMATVTLFTMMMDLCRRETAGTDYTLQACVVVVAQISAGSVSGFFAAALGYAGTFGLSAALSLGGALLAALLLARRRFSLP